MFCRVKPLSDCTTISAVAYPEQQHQNEAILTTIDLRIKDKVATYFFDRVFEEKTSQEEVFEAIKPLFQSSVDGDQVTILAYGQTGSGKTFTLEGPSLKNATEVNPSSGILPRAVEFLFGEVERLVSISKVDIHLSALEIYNETLKDLLSGQTDTGQKGQHADKLGISFVKERVHVRGLTWVKIESSSQLLDYVAKASQNRTTDKTSWNDRYSNQKPR